MRTVFDMFMRERRLARGVRAHIVDAKELAIDGESLVVRGERIDLVYNRCTDFYFAEPAHTAPPDIEVLAAAIPSTRRAGDPGALGWDERKQWFFKPASGFGNRGTYRGDKITRRAFDDVMRGDYIAQRIAPPSERRRPSATKSDCFKLDVRSYAYDGVQQLLAARLYQGQTTNFRTAGGGFAPLYVLRDSS